jgi:hypothetical protein
MRDAREASMGYEELMTEARKLLREAIEARYRGGPHGDKQQRAAYADGYMRALGDAGLASPEELLQLVAETRQELQGPALDTRDREAIAS